MPTFRVAHMIWVWCAAMMAGVITRELPAQTAERTAQNIVDAAASARTAFAAAARATTLDATLISLRKAAQAWPSQPAYWTAVARFAARASDTLVLVEALTALRGMRTGGVVVTDTAISRLRSIASVQHAVRALEGATHDLPAGHVIATLLDSTVFAEGMDAAARTGALYVASIRHGTVYEVAADGRVRDLALARHPHVGAMLGVRVSPDGRSLFVTTAALPAYAGYSAADSTLSALLQIRIRDGALEQRWDMTADGSPHVFGDLAVAPDGTVYVSDSYAPLLLRVRPGAGAFDSITHGLFRSLQGIAVVPHSNTLIVADYSHGLLRVNVDTKSVHRISDVPGTTSLGIDGIAWYAGSIVGVQNGVSPARVVRYHLNSDQSRIVRVVVVDQQPELADEPTIGAMLGDGFVYVANSQWEKFDNAGRRRATVPLQPTRLICVSLAAERATPDTAVQSVTGTARNGTRNTASAPPPSRACNVSDAPPE